MYMMHNLGEKMCSGQNLVAIFDSGVDKLVESRNSQTQLSSSRFPFSISLDSCLLCSSKLLRRRLRKLLGSICAQGDVSEKPILEIFRTR